jgi:hypothetical protein
LAAFFRVLEKLESTQHWTKESADEHIRQRRDQLQAKEGLLFDYRRNKKGITVAINKYNYLSMNPGDHILTEAYGISTHDAIYVGDGLVRLNLILT